MFKVFFWTLPEYSKMVVNMLNKICLTFRELKNEKLKNFLKLFKNCLKMLKLKWRFVGDKVKDKQEWKKINYVLANHPCASLAIIFFVSNDRPKICYTRLSVKDICMVTLKLLLVIIRWMYWSILIFYRPFYYTVEEHLSELASVRFSTTEI